MKLHGKIAALSVLLMMSAAAEAMPTDFTFDLNITSGGPAKIPVYVTLDGVTGSGIEVYRPSLNNLLKFEFSLFRTWVMTDATGFPSLPLIQLEDGLLTDIDFGGLRSEVGGRVTYSVNIQLNTRVNSVGGAVISPGFFTIAIGEVATQTWRQVAAPVPSPSSFVLLALGLAGLVIQQGRR